MPAARFARTRNRQHKVLEKIVRRQTSSQREVRRAKLVVHHTNFAGFVVSALALKRQLQTILTRHFWIGELLVLRIDQGNNNQQIARELGVHRETVQQWRSRWLAQILHLPNKPVKNK
jgi:DNA-binding NarL/FixJ family response regulator